MDFNNFTKCIKADVTAALAPANPDAVIDVAHTPVSRGEYLVSLRVAMKDGLTSINIDLFDSFRDYERGMPYNDVLADVTERARNSLNDLVSKPLKGLDVLRIKDYGFIKDKLCIEVVNANKKKSLLKQAPNTCYEDLAVIYKAQLHGDSINALTVNISNELLDGYGITKEQLHEDAVVNSQVIRPISVMTLDGVVANIAGIDESETFEATASGVYVITNKDTVGGAAALFYPDVMDNMAKKMESGFYILPSSVHEVLLMPDKIGVNAMELRSIVREVNNTAVPSKDWLSDNVYHYDAKSKVFEYGVDYDVRTKGKVILQGERVSVLKGMEECRQNAAERAVGTKKRTNNEPER